MRDNINDLSSVDKEVHRRIDQDRNRRLVACIRENPPHPPRRPKLPDLIHRPSYEMSPADTTVVDARDRFTDMEL